MGADEVLGGQVYAVGPLNVAYQEGERKTVYVKFAEGGDGDLFVWGGFLVCWALLMW